MIRLNKREKAIRKLVNIGLNYSVDYIYILQDIESLMELDLDKINIEKINKEDYLDY